MAPVEISSIFNSMTGFFFFCFSLSLKFEGGMVVPTTKAPILVSLTLSTVLRTPPTVPPAGPACVGGWLGASCCVVGDDAA